MKLPWLLLGAGIAIKGGLTASVPFMQPPRLTHFILSADPLARLVADAIVGVSFDSRRLAPPPAESLTWEVVLVAFFGVECFLVGLLVSMVWRRFAIVRRRA